MSGRVAADLRGMTYHANFDVPVVAAAMDREALIRNIVSRIEQAEFGASVGYLAGLPSDEAIAHELRSLLVDIEVQQGFETADWYLPDPELVIVGDEAYARADWEHKLSSLERKREYMRVYRQRRGGQIGALHELRCSGPHRGNKACHPIPMYSEEGER